MVALKDLPVKEIRLEDVPLYLRRAAENGATLIECGAVKRGGNEPYCYTQEKCCSGHICRVIGSFDYNKCREKVEVDRDDGTAWGILLEPFETVTRLTVAKEVTA